MASQKKGPPEPRWLLDNENVIDCHVLQINTQFNDPCKVQWSNTGHRQQPDHESLTTRDKL